MRLVIIILAALSVSACATPVGSQAMLETGRLARLDPGEATKQDVYYLLGQPHDVSYGEALSAWTYYSARGSIDGWTLVPVAGLIRNGTNFDVTVLRLEFDTDDVLTGRDDEQFHHFQNSYRGWMQGWTPDITSEPVRLEMQRIGVAYDRGAAHQMAQFVEEMRRRQDIETSR